MRHLSYRSSSVLALALALVLAAMLLPVSADALELHGALLLGYSDRVGGSYLAPGEAHGEWENPSLSIGFAHRASDAIHANVRVNATSGAATIAEGWVAFDGFPFNGELTLGRFQKPLGEPLLTIGLSYPALLFHSASVNGGKFTMERGLWNAEIGLVNQNPLSALGTFVSGSPAFARPLPTGNVMPENSKEIYISLGRRFGGDWGSLGLTAMYSGTRMLKQDATLLATMGVFDLSRNDHRRNEWDVAADYTYGDNRIFGEYVVADLGALTLRAYNISAAHRWRDWEFVAGWDWLATNASVRPPSIPASWDRQRLTLAANWQVTGNMKLMSQYEFNQETLSGHGYPGKDGIPNDGFAVQAVFGF